MAFFGLGGHNKTAPGFGQASDPFAGLDDGEDDAALEFDDTYDGLGKQLQESGDAFNNDTFGESGPGAVGKDFDFFGQTAKVADVIEEEQVLFTRQQPTVKKAPGPPPVSSLQHASQATSSTRQAAKPFRTGYEKYREPQHIHDMEVDASIWGVAPKRPLGQIPAPPGPSSYFAPTTALAPAPVTAPVPVPVAPDIAPTTAPPPPSALASSAAAPAPASGRKVMSLEEVEAQMRAQAKASHQPTAQQTQSTPTVPATAPVPPHESQPHEHGQGIWPQEFGFQQQQHHQQQRQQMPPPMHAEQHGPPQVHGHPMPAHNRPQQQKHTPPATGPSPFAPHQGQYKHGQQQSTNIHPHGPNSHQQPPAQQNARRMPGVPTHPSHRQQGSFSGQPNPTQQQQQQQEQQQQQQQQQQQTPIASDVVSLEQNAKRAKRNHKIYLMSRDNGLMTPSDKNFVSRIQLQQLVAATGNTGEQAVDDLVEDFYFQVLSQIRGGQRQNPNQPLNNFAQTYLLQTGNRQPGMRRHGRLAENHMQRMEQQVQRAVEAAKTKPKNKQLVIEGSLGKISFSNAKTPKPLLNIKKADPGTAGAHHKVSARIIDRKSVLRTVELVYTTLMELEDLERKQPAPIASDNPELAQQHAEFSAMHMDLISRLWMELKIHEPIGATPIHPFIAFLSFAKGKKAIPRIFRLISDEQRKIMLTMIVVQLDRLEVVRTGVNPNPAAREAIELFSNAVMPPLFTFFNSANMSLAIGVIGIIIRNVNVEIVARSRIGLAFLTMILSRPELVKNSGESDEASWQEWVRLYNMFFDRVEPILPNIFLSPVNAGEDVNVWQFLAAIGVGASPDQQQRLVLAVKDRVMETIQVSKTLPASMAVHRLSHVNLFMRSIGLDVELLQ